MTRTALYRHYDAAGALLYVGITDCLTERDKQHRATAHWHGEVMRTETQWCDGRQAALIAEWEAIRDENPIHNKRRAPPACLMPVAEKRSYHQQALGAFFARKKGQQATLAKAVGISASYMSELLTGRRVPSLDVALRISAATGGAVSLRSWPNLLAIADAIAAENTTASQYPVRPILSVGAV